MSIFLASRLTSRAIRRGQAILAAALSLATLASAKVGLDELICVHRL